MDEEFVKAQAMHQAAVAQQAATDLKRKVINAGITLINFPLSVAILLGLELIGWVVLKVDGDFWHKVALAAVIAVFYLVIRKLLGFLYGLFVIATCFAGCLFMPIFNALVGFLTLLGIQAVLPQYFSFAPGSFWLGIIAGLAFGAAQIPELSSYTPPELKTEKPEEKPATTTTTHYHRY
jgi:hypothetical protein